MIANVRVLPFNEMKLAFDQLVSLIMNEEDEYALVYWMKSLVPEYLSNNSEFEALDNENKKEKTDIYSQHIFGSK